MFDMLILSRLIAPNCPLCTRTWQLESNGLKLYSNALGAINLIAAVYHDRKAHHISTYTYIAIIPFWSIIMFNHYYRMPNARARIYFQCNFCSRHKITKIISNLCMQNTHMYAGGGGGGAYSTQL